MKIKVIVIVLYPVRHGGKASQHVLILVAKGLTHRSRLALWPVVDDFLVGDSKVVDARPPASAGACFAGMTW